MRICILTPRFPIPENGGDVLRINNIARYLKAQGHQLVLLSFYENECDIKEAQKLYDKVYVVKRHGFVSFFYALLFWLSGKPIQCGYYYSKAFNRLFREVIETEMPDKYIAHLLRMVPYLEQNKLQDRAIVEMTDALSKTYGLSNEAKGGGLKRIIYTMEKELIKRFELHTIRLFPKVVLVSQTDIDYLKNLSEGTTNSLALHTNGVECPECMIRDYDAGKVCFIGNMRTLQNQDAVLHFVENILPLIQEEVPNVRFYIIGAEPPGCIVSLGERKNVVVTGFVEDLNAVISDACLAVAPVRVAAGIQNKVLVAMANCLPVVMTSIISHAIPELRHKENCLICDNENDFAVSCIRIIKDKKLRAELAEKGYDMVCRHYSWCEKLKGYESL